MNLFERERTPKKKAGQIARRGAATEKEENGYGEKVIMQ